MHNLIDFIGVAICFVYVIGAVIGGVLALIAWIMGYDD